jgi:hypothetical protein
LPYLVFTIAWSDAGVKLTPPSRRRPLQFTGAGQPRWIV